MREVMSSISIETRAEYKPKCMGRSIKGTVEEIKETKTRMLHVEYGNENYFAEEGKGREM
jgi:uncharacterized membrane-anchored protein